MVGGGALLSRIMGLWFVCFVDVTACVFGCGLDFQLVLPLFDGRNCCRMFISAASSGHFPAFPYCVAGTDTKLDNKYTALVENSIASFFTSCPRKRTEGLETTV